jgi:hypothetical protein
LNAVVESEVACLGDADVAEGILQWIVTGDAIDGCKRLLTSPVLTSQTHRLHAGRLVLRVVPEAQTLSDLRCLAASLAGCIGARTTPGDKLSSHLLIPFLESEEISKHKQRLSFSLPQPCL